MLNLLAVDLGASSGRVMRAAFNGDTLSLQEVRRFQNHPLYIKNRMYWNVYALLQEIKWGISEAGATHGDIKSMAIDSWAVDFGVVDKNGHLLDLPRHYRDPRNASALKSVVGQVGQWTLYDRTGIQLLPLNTLYQLYAMQQENRNLLDTAESLLLIPDLLNFLLTGEKRAEFTNATTTQFLNAQSQDWDRDLLAQLSLPHRLLPPIVQPGGILGDFHDVELQKVPSLQSTKVINTASHDTAAAVVSTPHHEDNYVYISSGTWSLIGTVVPKPVVDEKTASYNFTNEGGLRNYRLLKNVMGLWLIQETQRTLQAMGESHDIERLIHDARLATPFEFLFDPDDERLLTPGDIPATIRQICRETGQPLPDNPGTLVRGIFESLALKYRLVLDQLESVTGQQYGAVHIVGGGSQNRLLSQFTANATRRPVVTGPVEASAMGNVLVQLLALGEVGSQREMTYIVRRSVEPVTYIPRDQDAWDTAFRRFLRIFAGDHPRMAQ